ncbi:MAG: riboflavin biosynthesis protein RibF, partial [Oscillospiraceae bacterium]|nr:riboflavin biosynthesis protein RibF [Oscillospiraceae bacterium]
MIELSSSVKMNGMGTAAALGIFDGVHRGHRAVIGKAVEEARKNGLAPAVCTFKTSSINTKGSAYRPIYSDETKRVLLENEGAEFVFSPDFSDMRDMSPEEFAEKILCGVLNARIVVCGRDFRFGKNAACSAEGLKDICDNLGMRLCVVDDVTENGVRICSADIRRCISEGDMRSANLLLGHDYAVTGEVV